MVGSEDQLGVFLQSLPAVLELIEKELERVCQRGVSSAELQKVKNRMELGFLQGMETAAGKAEQLGFFEIVYGDAAALFERLNTLRAVTPADVQRVARKYFDSRKRTSVAVLPATPKSKSKSVSTPTPKSMSKSMSGRGAAA